VASKFVPCVSHLTKHFWLAKSCKATSMSAFAERADSAFSANFHFTAWQKRSKQRIRDAKRFNVLEGSRRDDTADNRRLPVDLRSIHRGSNASPVHFTHPIRDAACSDNGHKTDTRVAVLRVPCRSLISQNAGVKRVSGPSSVNVVASNLRLTLLLMQIEERFMEACALQNH